jgi:hypothetical protein
VASRHEGLRLLGGALQRQALDSDQPL